MHLPSPRLASLNGFPLLLLFLVASTVGMLFWGFSFDDNFITYRYAQHLLDHGELAFNLGEPVLGTTAPGYAVLLALLSAMTQISIPGLGTLLSVLALAAIAVFVGAIWSQHKGEFGAVLAAVFGILAFSLRWNIELLGSELFPAAALCFAAAFFLLSQDRDRLAGLLVSLSMIIRLDAALAAAAIAIVALVHRRRFPFAFLLWAAVPAFFYLLALFASFDTLVPNTLAAKQGEFHLVSAASYSEAEWQWLTRTLGGAGAASLLALALLGGVAIIRSGPTMGSLAPILAIASWIAFQEIFYRVVRVPFAPWYQLITVNVVVALASVGLVAGFPAAARLRLPARFAATLLLGVLAAALVFPSVRYVAAQARRPPDPRYTGYRELGEFLLHEKLSGKTVALTEIGIVGFFSGARILDLMGLVDPEVLEARREGWLPHLVASRQPCYIVDVNIFRAEHLGAILNASGIRDHYREVARFKDGRHPSVEVRLLEAVLPCT